MRLPRLAFREGPGETRLGRLIRRRLAHRRRRPRIRCPRCQWRPRRQDRWFCTCGHSWNTFDTGGRCPACGFQWADTACLRCHQWSRHLDWYEDSGPDH